MTLQTDFTKLQADFANLVAAISAVNADLATLLSDVNAAITPPPAPAPAPAPTPTPAPPAPTPAPIPAPPPAAPPPAPVTTATHPAVGWWSNALDTAPIAPRVVLDYCSGTYTVDYSVAQAQRVAGQIRSGGGTMALGVGPTTAAQANAIAAICNAAGLKNVWFRLMWEQNDNFCNPNWDYRSNLSAAAWISWFNAAAANLKAAMPGCKIVWNPTLTQSAPAGRTSYDTFSPACDYVAFDGYDAAGTLAAWEAAADAFIALAHGTWHKPWMIGEYGLAKEYGPNAGDDPAYIDAVAARCTTANGCVAHCYFSSTAAVGGITSELSNYPDCKARYVANFPADGGSWPQ
jgi:hypothetical protein